MAKSNSTFISQIAGSRRPSDIFVKVIEFCDRSDLYFATAECLKMTAFWEWPKTLRSENSLRSSAWPMDIPNYGLRTCCIIVSSPILSCLKPKLNRNCGNEIRPANRRRHFRCRRVLADGPGQIAPALGRDDRHWTYYQPMARTGSATNCRRYAGE